MSCSDFLFVVASFNKVCLSFAGLRMANPELGGCLDASIKVPEKYKKVPNVYIPPNANQPPQNSCCT